MPTGIELFREILSRTAPSDAAARGVASWCVVLVFLVSPVTAFDTIGEGYGSKWGDAPEAGNGAIVTWGYMLDGTELDPDGFPFHEAITGASDITQVRNAVDASYGAGAFDAAIQRAFDTWSAVANITFVGPITDSGLPVGAVGAISPNIRIGAFEAVPGEWFQYGGAIGLGPPGPPNPFDQFPLSGDVIFNVNGNGQLTPFQIAPGTEDMTPVDVFNYGDDVEGLFLHELGHAAIGLDHPFWDGEDPDQRVMYVGDFENEEAPFCCQALNRQLHPDDIAGAQYVYGLRGDYNRNGEVDAADYTVWRDSVSLSVTSGTGADGNVDGTIDELDFLVWREHFGEVAAIASGADGASPLTAPVPEPSSLLLLPLAAGSLLLRARWTSKSLGGPSL